MTKWYNDNGLQNDVVLSTRIRLARNLKSIPFPSSMTADDAKHVIDVVEGALDEMNYEFTKYDLTEMKHDEKQRLVEERYISPDMAKSKLPCAAYISTDENVSIMVNEEDHIRIQCIFAGFEDKKAYDLISKIDTYLSEKLDYAVHEKYGYLTSCLTNVGTGMRVSYMVHIPALVKSGIADNVFSTIGKIGVAVRGMYGEGTKPVGYIYQLSNQCTLGKDETEIMGELNETVNGIIAKERELRTTLSKQQGIILEDKIHRSYAALKSARIMQTSEMMDLLSDVRLGISLGYITDTDAKTVTNLMISASPAHITVDSKAADAFARDRERAKIIRETFNK